MLCDRYKTCKRQSVLWSVMGVRHGTADRVSPDTKELHVTFSYPKLDPKRTAPCCSQLAVACGCSKKKILFKCLVLKGASIVTEVDDPEPWRRRCVVDFLASGTVTSAESISWLSG